MQVRSLNAALQTMTVIKALDASKAFAKSRIAAKKMLIVLRTKSAP